MRQYYVDEVMELLTRWGPASGRNIRRALNEDKWWWQKWGNFDFYELMGEMVDRGLIVCYTQPGAYPCPLLYVYALKDERRPIPGVPLGRNITYMPME